MEITDSTEQAGNGDQQIPEWDADDAFTALLERLDDLCPSAAIAEPAAHRSTSGADAMPGGWETVWPDRLAAATGDLGVQVREVWLSPAEVAGIVRPNAPAVTFRRTASNPAGWVLVLDQRWGQVYRAELTDDPSDSWISAEDLAQSLEIAPDSRIAWMICDPLMPALAVDHHESDTPPLRRLLQLIRPDRSDLWSVVAFAAIVGALTLATPVAVQQLVNSVALGGLMQPVVVLALLLLAVLAFSAVLTAIEAYVVEIVQRRVLVRVVSDVARRLPRVRLEAFDGQHGPELVNRFFDVVTVQKVGATLLLDGVALLLQTVIGLLVLSFYHPLMLAFGVVLLVGIAIVIFVFGRGAVPTAIEESKSKYAIAGWLEELARRATELKTPAAGHFAVERADDLARAYLNARSDHYRIVFRQLAGALGLQVIASSALLGLGGGLVIIGQLTLGQLVASELIVTAIVASFAKLGKHLESYYDLLAAVDKLGVLFDLPLERSQGAIYQPERGAAAALALQGIRFERNGKTILDGFDLSVAPGERVAVIGPSGSGKSSIGDLILGLRAPAAGYVTLDGADLRELRLDTVREHVVRVRGPEIIEGTLEDNVRMGRGYVTGRDVRESLDAVGMLERALELPEGLRTRLSTAGAPLTRGEAIRVALARAIAGKPGLIILDEALGDLDQRSRRIALNALYSDDKPWSLLVLAPRDDDAERCTRVVHLTGNGGDPEGHAAASREEPSK